MDHIDCIKQSGHIEPLLSAGVSGNPPEIQVLIASLRPGT